jgi:hypothetical protein
MLSKLNPELQAHIHTEYITHPFFQSDLHIDLALINRMFDFRKQEVEEAFKTHNWRRWIFLHYGVNRQMAVLELCGKIEDAIFFSLVGDVWTDDSETGISSTFLESIFFINHNREHYKFMMTQNELQELERKSDYLTIYRAHSGHNQDGISWTLSPEVANDYLKLFNTTLITKLTIEKSQVIAYFNRKCQEEIIYFPK